MKIHQKVLINGTPGVITSVEIVKHTAVYTIKLGKDEIRLTAREIKLNS